MAHRSQSRHRKHYQFHLWTSLKCAKQAPKPIQTDILFLFCGSTRRLIKGLVWEGDGFVLLSKRLQNGVFQWPRDRQEFMDLTQKQFSDLMNGLSIVSTI